MTRIETTLGSPKWITLDSHRLWLARQAEALFGFFERSLLNPRGGYHDLDDQGRPLAPGAAGGAKPSRQIHNTTRMVHCYSIAYLMGRPGADAIVDHGMAFIWDHHRDAQYGGYRWGIGDDGPTDDSKQAYGHAFVLLAASSAKTAGHPEADRLLADITQVLHDHFWDEAAGAAREEFTSDWQPLGRAYRGQNSNMHLTEALMAAFEATNDATYLRMAERIATLIIGRHAKESGWTLPEHFTQDWQVDRAYAGDPVFRPYGTTPGHSLEWTRLLLQLWELGGRTLDWLPGAAANLFARATRDGWDKAKGGFYYTLDWDDSGRNCDRYWWPCCEGIGAAAFLNAIDGSLIYEDWYRRIWDFTAGHLIDHDNGGWHAQLDDDLRPRTDPFFGKPDLYHALQACLIPLLPTSGSIIAGLQRQSIRLSWRE